MADDLKNLLNETLSLRARRNPAYSLRALARDLNISPSTLSEILNGKYEPSPRTVAKVATRLNLSRSTLENLQRKASQSHSTQTTSGEVTTTGDNTANDPDHSYFEFDRSQFSMIADWYYLAIMALMDDGLYVDEAQKVAEALGISVRNASSAIAQLCEMDLLRQDLDGRLTTSFQTTFVPDNVSPEKMKEFHFRVLEMAKEALKYVPRKLRFFETRFLYLSEDGYAEAQEILLEAGKKINALSAKHKNRTTVYNVAWQLFPANGAMRNRYSTDGVFKPTSKVTNDELGE